MKKDFKVVVQLSMNSPSRVETLIRASNSKNASKLALKK